MSTRSAGPAAGEAVSVPVGDPDVASPDGEVGLVAVLVHPVRTTVMLASTSNRTRKARRKSLSLAVLGGAPMSFVKQRRWVV